VANAVVEGRLTDELRSEVQRNLARLQDFKAELHEKYTIRRFTTPDTVASEVERALRDWRKRHPEFDASQPPEPAAAACDPDRYLAALDEDNAYINIRGLIVGSGQAHRFPIDELYIPLTTASSPGGRDRPDGDRKGGDASDTMDSGRVELDEALQHRRLTIVGDPGAGKTTFVRRIAHLLCRARREPSAADLPQEKLGLEGRPFPVLIRVSDLVELGTNAACPNSGPICTIRSSPGWPARASSVPTGRPPRRQ
jgi:hypothetical protein